MKTVNVKYLLSTEAVKHWDDFDLPLAVTDQNGMLYVITAGAVYDEMDGDIESYFIANLMTGVVDTEGFEGISQIVSLYETQGLTLTPVKLDLIVAEYLKASL